MNDPHVDMLHYSIRHSEGVDYTAASPQEGRHTSFTVRIESGQATVSMVDHCATAEDARVIVEPFLRAWELSSALSDWSGFEFVSSVRTLSTAALARDPLTPKPDSTRLVD